MLDDGRYEAFKEQDSSVHSSVFTFTSVAPMPQMPPSTSWPHALSPTPGPPQPSHPSFASLEPGIQTSQLFSGAMSMQSLVHGYIASQTAA